MSRPKNEDLLAVMELHDVEFAVSAGDSFSNGYMVVVMHGRLLCHVSTPDVDFLSTWDREREEAERQMAEMLKTGATIWCRHGDAHMSWNVPRFSTLEELRMKASVAGKTHG